MNQGDVVRWPVPRGVPRSGALLWRTPRPVSAALFTVWSGRPVGSSLRRRVITDALRAGMGLMNSGEADRALRFYDPACEIHIGVGFPLDAEPGKCARATRDHSLRSPGRDREGVPRARRGGGRGLRCAKRLTHETTRIRTKKPLHTA